MVDPLLSRRGTLHFPLLFKEGPLCISPSFSRRGQGVVDPAASAEPNLQLIELVSFRGGWHPCRPSPVLFVPLSPNK